MNKATRSWLLISGSLLLLAACTWLATKGELVLGEEYILGFAYNLPEEFRVIFLFVTMLGSVWILAIVLSLLLVIERFDIAIRVIISSGLAYVITILAKEIVGRPRPGLLVDVLQRELLVFGYGFPSAHVALATSIAIVLGSYLPKKRHFIVPLWIGLVALSRLYLGVHAPLDIVGGFCIGLLAASCVLLVLPPHKALRGIRVAKKRKHA